VALADRVRNAQTAPLLGQIDASVDAVGERGQQQAEGVDRLAQIVARCREEARLCRIRLLRAAPRGIHLLQRCLEQLAFLLGLAPQRHVLEAELQ